MPVPLKMSFFKLRKAVFLYDRMMVQKAINIGAVFIGEKINKRRSVKEFNMDGDKYGSGIAKVLFDGDDAAHIVLTDENGRNVKFEQVYAAVDGGVVYCILAPVGKILFCDENDAFLFTVSDDGRFTVVRDSTVSERIFSGYYQALRRGE